MNKEQQLTVVARINSGVSISAIAREFNFIRITAGTMDSYGSHENTLNNDMISQAPTIQRYYLHIEYMTQVY